MILNIPYEDGSPLSPLFSPQSQCHMVFYWPWPALFPQRSCPPVPSVTFQQCQHSARHSSLQRRTNKVPANKPVSISQSTSMPLVKKAVKESDQQSHWLTMVQIKANTSLWMTKADDESLWCRERLMMMIHYGKEKGWWQVTTVQTRADDVSLWYRKRMMSHNVTKADNESQEERLMKSHYGTEKG